MIAQLVEHDLAKVGVASSSLVHRSVKILQDLFLHLFSKSHPRREKLVFFEIEEEEVRAAKSRHRRES